MRREPLPGTDSVVNVTGPPERVYCYASRTQIVVSRELGMRGLNPLSGSVFDQELACVVYNRKPGVKGSGPLKIDSAVPSRTPLMKSIYGSLNPTASFSTRTTCFSVVICFV